MNDDMVKKWTALSKKAQESLKKLNSLNTSSLKQLTKLQMDMVSSCLEGGVEKAKSLSKAQSLSELMAMQSTLYKELSEKVLKNAQSSVKVAMETKHAMSELIKQGLSDVSPIAVKTSVSSTVQKTAATKKKTAKPAARKAAAKPAAKKAAAKPATKKAAAKPAAKKTAVKPVTKKAAPKAKPAPKLEMPKPPLQSRAEGDAKK